MLASQEHLTDSDAAREASAAAVARLAECQAAWTEVGDQGYLFPYSPVVFDALEEGINCKPTCVPFYVRCASLSQQCATLRSVCGQTSVRQSIVPAFREDGDTGPSTPQRSRAGRKGEVVRTVDAAFCSPSPHRPIARGLRPEPKQRHLLFTTLQVMHKMLAGLLDQYTLANNRQAYDMAVALAGWVQRYVKSVLRRRGQSQWQVGSCLFVCVRLVPSPLRMPTTGTHHSRWLRP